ncbi:MAG: histidine triad nucleotide-binding protein [Gemmatimonadaceae bacterium]|nr:histidine triad nucleotide-binding protein [Gemmatimonadaceae bacterium]
MTDCLFCRIARKEIPARIVAETDEYLAFHDVSPQAPTHVLVIPKAHVASLDGVTDPLVAGRVALLAAEVARSLGVAASGYRVVMNTGADGGQSVPHLHAHLLAGRAMQWPPG